MGLLRAIWRRLFLPPTAYERLVMEWISYERTWRVQYVRESPMRRRELVDQLRSERAIFHSRKLELESYERPLPVYRPGVLIPIGEDDVVEIP